MNTGSALDTAALSAARAGATERSIADARAIDEGGARDRAEIRRTAEAFEALLLRQLVTRMREAQIEGGLFGDGPGAGVYEGMFDDYISQHLTAGSPLGIADMLERQWTQAGVAMTDPHEGPGAAALSAGAAFRASRAYAATLRDAHSHEAPAVSRGFGWGQHPILGRRAHHDGLDFPAPDGTPVRAPRAGRVTRVDGADRGYGLQVVIEHHGGVSTRYAHLSSASVRPGDPIAPGAVLGRVGMTGRATGPHLHFETIVDGQPVDPRRLLGRSFAAQVLGPRTDETGER